MAKEEGGNHLSFSIIFLWRNFVNILVSVGVCSCMVLSQVKHLFGSLQPLFLAWFPKEVQAGKATITIIFWLRGCSAACTKWSAIQTAERQWRLFIYTLFIRSYNGTDMGCGGGQTDRGRQDFCMLEMDASSRSACVCVSPVDQLADWHLASPAAVLGSPCKKD